jgi:hypothetical protein
MCVWQQIFRPADSVMLVLHSWFKLHHHMAVTKIWTIFKVLASSLTKRIDSQQETRELIAYDWGGGVKENYYVATLYLGHTYIFTKYRKVWFLCSYFHLYFSGRTSRTKWEGLSKKNASGLSASFLAAHLAWELRSTTTQVHWVFSCCFLAVLQLYVDSKVRYCH